MLNIDELGARIIFSFGDGSFYITESTLFGFIVAAFLAVLGIWLGSRLETIPRGKQIFAELIVDWVYRFTEKYMGKENLGYASYIGTLFGFVFSASALGMIGIRPITADLNVAFGLSLTTFFMILINSLRVQGIGGKLRHMAEPYAFLFPLKVLEEITLPVSLGLRLFGNILGGYIIVELWMHLMVKLTNIFGTIPFLRILSLPLNVVFDIAEPMLQSFIFTSLTIINLAAGVKITSAAHKFTASGKNKHGKRNRNLQRKQAETSPLTAEEEAAAI